MSYRSFLSICYRRTYNDEARELWTIPEVRIWMAVLETHTPHIAFFLSPFNGNLNFFFSTKLTYTDDGLAVASQEKLASLLLDTYGVMNEYCERAGIDAEHSEPYQHHCTEIAKVLGASSPLVQ